MDANELLKQMKEQLKLELRQELKQEIEREVSSSRFTKPWYEVARYIDKKLEALTKLTTKQSYQMGTATNTVIRLKLGYKNVVDLKPEHVPFAKEIASQVISILSENHIKEASQ